LCRAHRRELQGSLRANGRASLADRSAAARVVARIAAFRACAGTALASRHALRRTHRAWSEFLQHRSDTSIQEKDMGNQMNQDQGKQGTSKPGASNDQNRQDDKNRQGSQQGSQGGMSGDKQQGKSGRSDNTND